MNFNARRVRFSILTAVALFALTLILWPGSPWRSQAEGLVSPIAEMWRLTPPAPKVAEIDRVGELRARRQEVLKRLGDKGVMVLFSAEPRVYTYDVDYHYRQENNLYYLTGIKQDGATLVLIPGAKKTREILFMPKRSPYKETWTGKMMSPDEARTCSGVQEVLDSDLLTPLLTTLGWQLKQPVDTKIKKEVPPIDVKLEAQWQDDFQALIKTVKANDAELYLLTPKTSDLREYRQEYDFAEKLSKAYPGLKIKPGHPIFAELRLHKSPWEIKLLQHAVDISSEAFHRVMAAAMPGMREYEIQAEFEYTFRRRGADNWGYPCIVGAGANATTLHYITNQEALDDNSLLLMDCASEFDHYTADITRTIPINGKFTKEQAEIYQIVYESQLESIKMVRSGNLIGSVFDGNKTVQGRAAEVIKDGLLKLGLITTKDSNEFRTWFMHGTSHWIGMNVHDVGDYATPLAAGMVLTVEPGIYIRPDALDVLPKTPENERFIKAVRPAFEKYKGIGVRIEDDILVTTGDPVVMSQAIPRKLDELEMTIARLRQELRKSGWPQVAAR